MAVVWGLRVVGKVAERRVEPNGGAVLPYGRIFDSRPYDGRAAAARRTAFMVPSGCIVAAVQRGSNSTR